MPQTGLNGQLNIVAGAHRTVGKPYHSGLWIGRADPDLALLGFIGLVRLGARGLRGAQLVQGAPRLGHTAGDVPRRAPLRRLPPVLARRRVALRLRLKLRDQLTGQFFQSRQLVRPPERTFPALARALVPSIAISASLTTPSASNAVRLSVSRRSRIAAWLNRKSPSP